MRLHTKNHEIEKKVPTESDLSSRSRKMFEQISTQPLKKGVGGRGGAAVLFFVNIRKGKGTHKKMSGQT